MFFTVIWLVLIKTSVGNTQVFLSGAVKAIGFCVFGIRGFS